MTYTKIWKPNFIHVGIKMKVKENSEIEILSNLKSLEEEYDEMMYFNNSPPDMSIVATKWMQQYLSKRKNNGE
ncbi:MULTISPECIES: hypothetical protein [Pantoea]|uniref:Uncharacterized protein n=1 Tax=Pantoea brenneri TaxID=472694 RepID=A0ABU9ME58_9GAMM|nr:hypothetical protein [Pantoea sp. 3.5.1]KKD32744.1 hypothetical protein EP46_02090 [Pantoea sp. 3.5.1]